MPHKHTGSKSDTEASYVESCGWDSCLPTTVHTTAATFALTMFRERVERYRHTHVSLFVREFVPSSAVVGLCVSACSRPG